MLRNVVSVVLSGLFCVTAPAAFAESAYDQLTVGVYQHRIARQLETANILNTVVEQYCTGQVTLQDAQQSWKQLVLSWSQLEAVSYQWLDRSGIGWRFQFWPDRRDLTRKKVRQLLKENDVSVAELNQRSSIVQGVTALEYMLYP